MSSLPLPVPRSSPALRALRAATCAANQGLETGLRIAMPGAGRHAYSQYAAAMWGWLQPVETSIWSGGWPTEIDVPARAVKARWLEEDLVRARQEGYLEAELPRRDARFAFRTLAERMGCAYVVEGALLSATALRRRLAPALFPWPMRFLAGYGEQGAERWDAFVQVLDTHLDTDVRIEDATHSATRTLTTLVAWMRNQGAA